MEMRAGEDTGMSQDLTPPIPPIATALHDPFLRSHCSACFLPLSSSSSSSSPLLLTHLSHPSNPSPPLPLSCSACDSSLLYCSSDCSASDFSLHVSSAECRLFRLLPFSPPAADTADLRAALRLLRSLDLIGLLPPPTRSEPPTRIGGLLASDLEAVIEEGGEISERIREGGALISRARNAERGRDLSPIGPSVEEAALWAVLTNAVEVQVSEGAAIGVAVYGPRFSWFNHSCSPNACYRFELSSRSEPAGSSDPGYLRVMPAGTGVGPEVRRTWTYGESKLIHDLCSYGPRIILRSIKAIKKGEEVCIAYIDLLQPKAMRHFDLWSKYRFVCCCDRCNASPPLYIDYILNCDARNLNSSQNKYSDAECGDLADFLDQTIAEYMSDGSSEACCRKLGNMLSEIFQESQFQVEEQSKMKFWLHPLHYLSLKVYITLASAYRITSSNLLALASDEDDTLESFKMCRAAAACSLLLAGASQHLFMSESSLISSTALFWVSAGKSILPLVISSYEAAFTLFSDRSWCTISVDSSLSWDECKTTSMRFLDCISNILTRSWPSLVEGLAYLEKIKSPIDFSWLGLANIHQILASDRSVTYSCVCPGCKYKAEVCVDEKKRFLFQLAVHCLIYGRYLANICYGPQCYLADNVRNLLHGIW